MPPSLAAALPNIVLLVADDIPRNMLGAYGAEGGLSPNIDRRLAGAGLTFERAYTTAPLCTPSRFTLLTGRYAANASSIPSHRPWNMVGFNTFLTGDEPTIAHRLQRAGYSTCFVGKVRARASACHAEGTPRTRPTDAHRALRTSAPRWAGRWPTFRTRPPTSS